MPILNDVQSRLNTTEVSEVVRAVSPEDVAAAIAEAASRGLQVCPAGSLHSMGGQQLVKGGVSLSSAGLNGVGPLDRDPRTVSVQAGVGWPQLVEWLRREQHGETAALTIIQKQTGADEMTLGGALSSNIHGRVLGRKPIVDDIESFSLIGPSGERLRCSRAHNSKLFRLAIGGYGLFGFVDSINLRLEERRPMVRRVGNFPWNRSFGSWRTRPSRGQRTATSSTLPMSHRQISWPRGSCPRTRPWKKPA